MRERHVEFYVGIFLLIGILGMGYVSVNLGQVNLFKTGVYPVLARFSSVTGLRSDTDVEIAGVPVGKVEKIRLDDYEAEVTLLIDENVKVQEDAIASIHTKGILGEKYVEIKPGASSIYLEPGDLIFDTEPPFDLLSVIKNLVIEK